MWPRPPCSRDHTPRTRTTSTNCLRRQRVIHLRPARVALTAAYLPSPPVNPPARPPTHPPARLPAPRPPCGLLPPARGGHVTGFGVPLVGPPRANALVLQLRFFKSQWNLSLIQGPAPAPAFCCSRVAWSACVRWPPIHTKRVHADAHSGHSAPNIGITHEKGKVNV